MKNRVLLKSALLLLLIAANGLVTASEVSLFKQVDLLGYGTFGPRIVEIIGGPV